MIKTINSWKEVSDVPEALYMSFDRVHIGDYYGYYEKTINDAKHIIVAADNGAFWKSDGQEDATHVFIIKEGLISKHFALKGLVGVDLLFVRASFDEDGLKEAIEECMKRY